MSCEKFVMDLDNCGAMLRLLQGMTIDADSLSRESSVEAGPGNNFLSTTRTLTHFARAAKARLGKRQRETDRARGRDDDDDREPRKPDGTVKARRPYARDFDVPDDKVQESFIDPDSRIM